MTKTEFLDILRNSLSSDKVNENINYYDDYIEQSVAKGKSYDEVFNELGDPRLIAKTIIDTYKMSDEYQYQQASQDRNYENNPYHNNDYRDTYSGGEHKNKGFNINIDSSMPWYLKLLGILLIILAIVVIVALGGVAIHLFFSIIVPILFVYFIVRLIFNIFNH